MLSSRPQPSAFSCGSNPTGAANMVSGVLITVASRGSPSSAVCTLCLQQRRDACEPRSKGTQGVPVYTKDTKDTKYAKYSNGVSVDSLDTWFHSCYSTCMPCLPCLPRRNGMPVSIVGLASCPLTSQSAIDSNCILSTSATSDLPPFLRLRGAVNSTQTRYPTYYIHTW